MLGNSTKIHLYFTYLILFRILHLFFTIAIQMTIMRDIEKLTGSLRIGIIYLFSGVGGYLASSIFVPYRAEVNHFQN